MALKAADFPPALYDGYFEFLESEDKKTVTARVYSRSGSVPAHVFDGSPEDAEAFVVAAMAGMQKEK